MLLFALLRYAAPGATLALSAPLFSAGNTLAASAGSFFASFGDARRLAEDNRTLQEENATLSLENRMLIERLADISALLGTTTPPEAGVVAGVVARPPTAAYDTLVLAAGTDAGVAAEMGAFGAGGMPLGFVTEVSRRYARVTLLSASGMVTDAWVGSARVPIILKGAGAGAFSASVPQGAGVVLGDLVYVAGPGAVPIGRVARVSEVSSDPIATLSIRPMTNPFTITWVALRDVGEDFLRSTATTTEPVP